MDLGRRIDAELGEVLERRGVYLVDNWESSVSDEESYRALVSSEEGYYSVDSAGQLVKASQAIYFPDGVVLDVVAARESGLEEFRGWRLCRSVEEAREFFADRIVSDSTDNLLGRE